MSESAPPGGPEPSPEIGSETNWAGSHRYPFRLLRPRSLDELQAIVASSDRLRALGSRHAFNAICDGELAVSLQELPERVEVDREAGTVSCSGQATYGAVARALAPEGLALANLASLPHVCVAGAVATGTHGSGSRNGNLATAVSALDIVTASGDLVTLKRGEPGFDGAVVSLGTLGVTVRVTLDVQPAYDVAQRVYEGLSWDALGQHFEAVMGAGYSVSLFTDWGDLGPDAWVKSVRADDDPGAELFGARVATVDRNPLAGLDPVNINPQGGVWGSWADRLPHFRMGFVPSSGAEIQSEYHLPRGLAVPAIETLRAVAGQLQPVLQVSEIRTVRADELWLSPHQGRDSVSLHFTWIPDQVAVARAVALVEAVLEPFAPRPHWGKHFRRGAVGDAAYLRLDDFHALRRAFDPAEKFVNEWVREQGLVG